MPFRSDFSDKDKAQCVLWMAELGSAVKARRRFYNENGRYKQPSLNSIKQWHKKFIDSGSMKSPTKRGRKPVGPADVDEISELFSTNPKISIRSAARNLNLAKSVVQRVVRKQLKLYPYKIQRLHALKEEDYGRREEFAEIMLHRANADPDYLRRVCFSDESTFHTSGLVHRHNCRIWGQEKPREIRQWERASPKVNVWCGVFIDAIIGPFILKIKQLIRRKKIRNA